MKINSISPLLSTGEENAIQGRELTRKLNIDTRELRHRVEHERNNGILILSSNKGYFLPEKDEAGQLTDKGYAETKKYYALHSAKAIGCFKSAKCARLAIKQYEEKTQTTVNKQGDKNNAK